MCITARCGGVETKVIVNRPSGEYGNTEKIRHYTFDASSGLFDKKKGLDFRKSIYQYAQDGGPTVEGDYILNLEPSPNRIAKYKAKIPKEVLARCEEGGIEQIPLGVQVKWDWGDERVRLEKVFVDETKLIDENGKLWDRDLSSFYFHDSLKRYSHGCTEIESRFFRILKKYRNKMGKKGNTNRKINVLVRYPDPKKHKTSWEFYNENN